MSDNQLKTNESIASYGIGLQMGQQLVQSGFENLDTNAILKGIEDSLKNIQPEISVEKINEALQELHSKTQEKKSMQAKEAAKQGQEFLEKNKTENPNISVTSSGLQYEIITEGQGEIPKSSDKVRVHYHGQLIDGTVFDSSVTREQPAEFPVNGVIKGWVEALQMMPVGSKWKLYIPHELAYGENGAGAAIPPSSALIFEVELLDII